MLYISKYIIFPTGSDGQVLNKDPTVWLNGAGHVSHPPSKGMRLHVCGAYPSSKVHLQLHEILMIHNSLYKLFSDGKFPNHFVRGIVRLQLTPPPNLVA